MLAHPDLPGGVLGNEAAAAPVFERQSSAVGTPLAAPPAVASSNAAHSTRVHIGMKLNKWVIISRIGAGSFGETFCAVDSADVPHQTILEADATQEEIDAWLGRLPPLEGKEVCVKVEQENKNVLRLEALLLKRVQSCAQVARYLGSGCTGGMHFLVMEKLGPNLADLRRRSMHGTFNIYTTLKAGISCLQAIREVHERGLIHRDIKPSNFITGIPGTPEHSTCYLIDFGLARRYRRSSGELREAREHAGFRGTSRYASVASHRHVELGRVDDLWSLLFMLIEFATGTLPWRKYRAKEDIGRCKERSIGPRLVRNLPREFQLFLSHLQSLHYEDEPDYELLLSCLHRAVERRGYPPDKLLDWQLDPQSEEMQQEEAAHVAQGQGEKKPNSAPKGDAGEMDNEGGKFGADQGHASTLQSPLPAEMSGPLDRVNSTVRVSEVDVSCPQTGRVEDAPQQGGEASPDAEVHAHRGEEQGEGAGKEFSPRENVPKRHRAHSQSKTGMAQAAMPAPDDVLLDDANLNPRPNGNGTTSINVPPPPPPQPQKPEKEHAKCKCLVM